MSSPEAEPLSFVSVNDGMGLIWMGSISNSHHPVQDAENQSGYGHRDAGYTQPTGVASPSHDANN
ncbi:hypothetical protein GCM10025780_08390 [Frondihabitans cladoniiphilus]|uniref:Uncharacterized protein n=2 Tax=Frondihabitans cladoniiphilus TaxID=715785 RepID=A0ABP8VRB9_9MICO